MRSLEQNNEIITFDTGLVSSFGSQVDISRNWWIGVGTPSDNRLYAMRHAHKHIMTNINMLTTGVSLRELTMKCHKLDNQFQAPRYNGMIRGWDSVTKDLLLPIQNTMSKALFYVVEAGMILSVKALVSPDVEDFSIKFEDQVLVTETGYENSRPIRLTGL